MQMMTTAGGINVNDIFSFARYLSWADLQNRLFEEELAREPEQSDQAAVHDHEWRWFGLMCYWYASLYVVIEAWDALGFTDPTVDRVLGHSNNYRDLLRRFRNGVFHFQSDMLDERFLALLREGAPHAIWIRVLHDEVIRAFREIIDRLMVTSEYQSEMRSSIQTVINWVPYADAPTFESIVQTLTRGKQLLAENADDHSELRQNVEQAMQDLEAEFHRGRQNWSEMRNRLLRQIGITA
jgi:hypothetical protein